MVNTKWLTPSLFLLCFLRRPPGRPGSSGAAKPGREGYRRLKAEDMLTAFTLDGPGLIPGVE